VSCQLHCPVALTLMKEPIRLKAKWVRDPGWMGRSEEICFVSAGNRKETTDNVSNK
jgi:hypothetical protein